MDNRKSRTVHHTIRGVLLLAFTAYVMLLVKRGTLGLYIAPSMQLYIKCSAIGLYVAGMYQLFAAWRSWRGRAEQADHGHLPRRFGPKEAAVYGLFLLPLLLGFLLPDTTMGSAMAERKGMNLNSAANIKKTTALAPSPDAANTIGNGNGGAPATAGEGQTPSGGEDAQTGAPSAQTPDAADTGAQESIDATKFPYDRYTEPFARFAQQLARESRIVVSDKSFIETLTTLDLYRDPLRGQTVQLTGFVYKEEGMPDNRFVVSRFTVQCCSADAAPYGILVAWEQAGALAKDSWVTVTGKLTTLEYGGNPLVAIEAVKIEKTSQPEDPYVYPDFEFGL